MAFLGRVLGIKIRVAARTAYDPGMGATEFSQFAFVHILRHHQESVSATRDTTGGPLCARSKNNAKQIQSFTGRGFNSELEFAQGRGGGNFVAARVGHELGACRHFTEPTEPRAASAL